MEPPPPPPPETATLSVCKEMASGSLGAPNNFAFTVTGNGPEPDEFLGDANCVEVSIGPGEYAVSEGQYVRRIPLYSSARGSMYARFYQCAKSHWRDTSR